MSSSDNSGPISRRAILMTLAGLPLAGCVRPMYATIDSKGTVTNSQLAAIDIKPIPERFGHFLTEDLRFAFHGGSPAATMKYRLEITLTRSVVTPIIDTSTGRADVATMRADAYFRLLPYEGGTVLVDGRATGSASFDRLTQRYAGLRAGIDSEKRVAETLAEQIQTRIAAYFATKS
jgi:LPS-assembly lipoprotein